MSILAQPLGVLDTLRRVGRAVAWLLIVVASLLVPPNATAWMAAAWLLAYTLLVVSGRRGRVCLVACAAILVAKRLTLAPGLLAWIAVMVAVVLLDLVRARRRETSPSRRFAWLSVLALWIGWGGMTADWFAATHCRHSVTLRADRPVVCFGDSMTSQGLYGGYPRDLQELVSVPVVNLGLPGFSASQALEYLPDLVRHNPQVVVVEFGGHDFLRGYTRAATKADLLAIVAAARGIGAEVILMEIPRAYMSDPFWGLEREIARQEDIELMPDTTLRTLFLRSPAFPPGSWLGEPYLTEEDGIHPNRRGNRLLAEHVARALERLYGPAIRRWRKG